jgi:hypothetical protein
MDYPTTGIYVNRISMSSISLKTERYIALVKSKCDESS